MPEKFQFHSGSIKTDKELSDHARQVEFQFHSGSIKTYGIICPPVKERKGFNSTLVRLRRQRRLHNEEARAAVSIPLWFD